MKRGLNIGEAVEALHKGERLSREGWPNAHDVFIFKQVPSEINKEIVPRMQSLPPLVKDYFIWSFEDPKSQINAIYYDNQVAKVSPTNMITAYAPSIEDLFAKDWYIID